MVNETGKIRIAMADDHVIVRQAIAAMLNSFPDCEVIMQADSGKDLLANLQTGDLPDLVILDVSMPEVDGYRAAEVLRARFPGIRVLVLTSYDSELLTVRMLRAGARGVLAKFGETKELKEAIEAVMHIGYYYSGSTAEQITRILQSGVRLSDAELRFLELACTEMNYKEIAQVMKVSPRTVDSYRDDLFTKLDVTNRQGLIIYGMNNGLVKVSRRGRLGA